MQSNCCCCYHWHHMPCIQALRCHWKRSYHLSLCQKNFCNCSMRYYHTAAHCLNYHFVSQRGCESMSRFFIDVYAALLGLDSQSGLMRCNLTSNHSTWSATQGLLTPSVCHKQLSVFGLWWAQFFIGVPLLPEWILMNRNHRRMFSTCKTDSSTCSIINASSE